MIDRWLTPVQAEALPIIRETVAAMVASCSWLVPIRDDQGNVTDYVTAATSSQSVDIAGRGSDQRVGALLSELYPAIVGGDLWKAYEEVLREGEPLIIRDFVYDEDRSGVASRSVYDLSVHRLRGGLLVCWERIDESRRRLHQTELLGNLGWGEYNLLTERASWSPGMYRIFERDPADGPMSRAEQQSAVVPDDRLLLDAAWHMFEEGQTSDVTIRMRIGDRVKHLRVLGDVAYDRDGVPLKIYGVVQDVTAFVASGTALERAAESLRRQGLTLMGEHRVATNLQQIILPLPEEPFDLGGLRVLVRYLPAERRSRVGGDWYLATTDDEGAAICGIGDVAGHGLASATVMAQLRYALSGWIATGTTDPGQLMRFLNLLCLRLKTTATAVITRFDATSGALSWAQAGHPAPIHASAGVTTELARPAGLLLGTLDDAEYGTATMNLAAGDLLFMYTDGLVERAASDPFQRLTQVRNMLSIASGTQQDQPLALLQQVLQDANEDDDTCLLALRRLRVNEAFT